jgi:hypothetical protein
VRGSISPCTLQLLKGKYYWTHWWIPIKAKVTLLGN